MSIKEKAINLVERQITKTALVLETRAWTGNTFYEVDLHLPNVYLDKNNSVYHINCRVAPLTFRDYTIAQWNAQTSICTLLIDAGHIGYGSQWVKKLNKGDTIAYINIESHRYYLNGDCRHIFLGDQSAVGHYLALQQLAEDADTVEGAVIIDSMSHRSELAYYYPDCKLQALPLKYSAEVTLEGWLEKQLVSANDIIYLTGNSHMVVGLRQQLRINGHPSKNIKVQGFWK